jgi:hypothetical protein
MKRYSWLVGIENIYEFEQLFITTLKNPLAHQNMRLLLQDILFKLRDTCLDRANGRMFVGGVLKIGRKLYNGKNTTSLEVLYEMQERPHCIVALGYRDHALFEQYLREPDAVTLELAPEERNIVKNFHKPFRKAVQRHERNGSKSDIPSESQVSEWATVVKKKLWDVASCVYFTMYLRTANANAAEEEKAPDYKIEFPLRDDCFLLWELGKNLFMVLSRDTALSQRSRCYTCETDLISIYGSEAIEPFHVKMVKGKKTIISEGEGSGILLCPRCYALASQLELSLDDLKLRFAKRT